MRMKTQHRVHRGEGKDGFKRMKNIFFAMLCVTFCLTACGTPSPPLPQQQQAALTKKLIREDDFLGIFEHRRDLSETIPGNNQILDTAVEAYILNCCRDKDDAIKLLENNGFKVSPTRSWTTREYTEAFHGWRFSKPINFITATQYHVSIYIIDGKVKKVTASHFTDLKPPSEFSKKIKPRRLAN